MTPDEAMVLLEGAPGWNFRDLTLIEEGVYRDALSPFDAPEIEEGLRMLLAGSRRRPSAAEVMEACVAARRNRVLREVPALPKSSEEVGQVMAEMPPEVREKLKELRRRWAGG